MDSADQSSLRVAGVDGTKGGWVVIVLEDGRFARDQLLDLATDFAEVDDVRVLAIDIPIGFGPRDADPAARRFMRGAASTVFSAHRGTSSINHLVRGFESQRKLMRWEVACCG